MDILLKIRNVRGGGNQCLWWAQKSRPKTAWSL